MDVEAARMIGAGLAMFALAGVGLGIGLIFSSLINATARNPSAREITGLYPSSVVILRMS